MPPLPCTHLRQIHPATLLYNADQRRRITSATTPRLRLSILPPLFHHRHRISSSTTGTTYLVPNLSPTSHHPVTNCAQSLQFRLGSAPGLAPTPKASIQPTPCSILAGSPLHAPPAEPPGPHPSPLARPIPTPPLRCVHPQEQRGKGLPLCFGQHAAADPPPVKQAPVQLEQEAAGLGRSAEMALFRSHRRQGAAAGHLALIWGFLLWSTARRRRGDS